MGVGCSTTGVGQRQQSYNTDNKVLGLWCRRGHRGCVSVRWHRSARYRRVIRVLARPPGGRERPSEPRAAEKPSGSRVPPRLPGTSYPRPPGLARRFPAARGYGGLSPSTNPLYAAVSPVLGDGWNRGWSKTGGIGDGQARWPAGSGPAGPRPGPRPCWIRFPPGRLGVSSPWAPGAHLRRGSFRRQNPRRRYARYAAAFWRPCPRERMRHPSGNHTPRGTHAAPFLAAPLPRTVT